METEREPAAAASSAATKTSAVTGTLTLQKEEGAALVSACLAILTDLLKSGERLPDPAWPLFRVYCKLCALSNHRANLQILQAAMATWGEAATRGEGQ